MKILRIAGLIIFLLSAAVFAGFKGYQVKNSDTAGPEITFQQGILSVSTKTSKEEFLQGVTAWDEKDGDVTDSVLIEDISRLNPDGTRTITYAAFDKSGNITKSEREMRYTDYNSPRFSLKEPLRFTVGNTGSLIANMTAEDCLDGDLTNKIKYEENRKFGQAEGLYKVEFQVTNSAGDTSVLDTEVEFYYPDYQNQDFIPKLKLSQYIVYIKTGETLDADSYLKEVTIGKEQYSFVKAQELSKDVKTMSMDQVKIIDHFNNQVPGAYTITYSMTTEAGFTGQTRLIVVVEE